MMGEHRILEAEGLNNVSGPNATPKLSRYTVAAEAAALRLPGVAGESRYTT